MNTMHCDKCGENVEPSNNALLYDAAFEALTTHTSQAETLDTLVTGITRPTFREGEIIHGDPKASIESVLKTQGRGRHFHATAICEGSPSRRKNTEEGRWGDGKEMDAISADAAKKAYDLMNSLSSK